MAVNRLPSRVVQKGEDLEISSGCFQGGCKSHFAAGSLVHWLQAFDHDLSSLRAPAFANSSDASAAIPKAALPSCFPTSGRQPGNQPLHPDLPPRPALGTSLASPQWICRTDAI